MAFCLFFFIELVRIFRVWIPYLPSHSIDLFLRQFIESSDGPKVKVDEKPEETPYPDDSSAQFFRSWDLGPLILSHFYLLLACAIPHWISASITSLNKPQLNAISSSGVIFIGIGDTFAAIVGHMIGTIKWPKRRISIQGSLAFFVSTLLIHIILDYQNSILYAVVCAFGAILEAVSYQNDNLVLSIWTCSCTIMLLNL